ncbi:hypothetical protein L7F22_036993 [Adiantum nelumboides]|nr:hypothetical protein [Adiantum nelumboides]
MQTDLGLVFNPYSVNALEDDANSDCQHPLATQEWLASYILQKFCESADIDVPALCEFVLINKNFLAACNADSLWEKLLPPASHLASLFKECDDADLLQFYRNLQSKKALYQRLCRPISLAGGLQKFWLDRRTGKECYIMSARALSVIWGSTPQYWGWPRCLGAWFPEVACLHSVCWFEITGKFRELLRPGSYTVSFRMQIHSASSWRWSPVKLSLRNVTYAHESVESQRFFQGQFFISSLAPFFTPPRSKESELSHYSTHEWIECDVGEFTVEENEDRPIEVEFAMRETEVLNWKDGFLLDGVFIRPNCVVKALPRPTISIDDDIVCVHESFGYPGVDYYDRDQDNEFEDGVNDDDDGLSHSEQEAT